MLNIILIFFLININRDDLDWHWMTWKGNVKTEDRYWILNFVYVSSCRTQLTYFLFFKSSKKGFSILRSQFFKYFLSILFLYVVEPLAGLNFNIARNPGSRLDVLLGTARWQSAQVCDTRPMICALRFRLNSRKVWKKEIRKKVWNFKPWKIYTSDSAERLL